VAPGKVHRRLAVASAPRRHFFGTQIQMKVAQKEEKMEILKDSQSKKMKKTPMKPSWWCD